MERFSASLPFYPNKNLFERREIRLAERAALKAAGYDKEIWYFDNRADAARWALTVDSTCGVRLNVGACMAGDF